MLAAGTGAGVAGVCEGRTLFDSEVMANTSAPPRVKNARQLPVPPQLRRTHPEPSERGIIFSSLLSDTDSHAGKRKHLLSDAVATSSSEGSSQSFILQNEGADPSGRTACALGCWLLPPSGSRSRFGLIRSRPLAGSWGTFSDTDLDL